MKTLPCPPRSQSFTGIYLLQSGVNLGLLPLVFGLVDPWCSVSTPIHDQDIKRPQKVEISDSPLAKPILPKPTIEEVEDKDESPAINPLPSTWPCDWASHLQLCVVSQLDLIALWMHIIRDFKERVLHGLQRSIGDIEVFP